MVSKTARFLRKNLTEAEQKLWSRLRRKQLHGFRFRRQRPIGPYIVDFVCLEASLIIEVDGGQHAEQISKDEVRTRFLEKEGFRVIRFWNNDVLANTDGVLDTMDVHDRHMPLWMTRLWRNRHGTGARADRGNA